MRCCLKKLFNKIKTTSEQKITEHKFKKQLAEYKTKKKQFEQQLEKQTKQLEILLGWENEFDDAPVEQKKMIICSLCDRIEVSRDYEVKIMIDMDYEQFCR